MSTPKSRGDKRPPRPPEVIAAASHRRYDAVVPSAGWFDNLVHLVDEYELTMLATPELLRRVSESGQEPTRIRDIYIPTSGSLPRFKVRWLNNGRQSGHGLVQPLMVLKSSAAKDEPGHWLKASLPLSWQEYKVLREGLSDFRDVPIVIKDRYKLTIDDHLVHVYVYMGELSGLVTVSFRKLSAKEYADLRDEAPKGCLPVDGKGFLLDGFALAGHRYRDLANVLAGYNYRKIDVSKFGLRRK